MSHAFASVQQIIMYDWHLTTNDESSKNCLAFSGPVQFCNLQQHKPEQPQQKQRCSPFPKRD